MLLLALLIVAILSLIGWGIWNKFFLSDDERLRRKKARLEDKIAEAERVRLLSEEVRELETKLEQNENQ